MNGEYWPRLIDAEITRKLREVGALSIEGPKGCGKTRTGRQFASSFVALSDPRNPSPTTAARNDPASILGGDTPRMIDEWQTVPSMWDAVRFEADERGLPGQFILAGSSVPPIEGRAHVGAGRFSCITMRPMSLFESRESSGRISLRGMLDGRPVEGCESGLDLDGVAGAIVRGGWPGAVTNGASGGGFADDYVETICRGGISLSDGVRRDPDRVRAILRSVARNISTAAAMTTISGDLNASEDGDVRLSHKSAISYYEALRNTFIVEDQPACGQTVRSATPLRETPKRQLCDPSLAASVLGLDEQGLRDDWRTFGFLFESLCVRDLRIYSDTLDAKVSHYHDSNDLEVDAIIETRDGRWGAVEVKLTDRGTDDGARNLLRLAEKMRRAGEKETGRQGTPSGKGKNPPAFMMVLTGTGYAYMRDDGVAVVPIGCLGP